DCLRLVADRVRHCRLIGWPSKLQSPWEPIHGTEYRTESSFLQKEGRLPGPLTPSHDVADTDVGVQDPCGSIHSRRTARGNGQCHTNHRQRAGGNILQVAGSSRGVESSTHGCRSVGEHPTSSLLKEPAVLIISKGCALSKGHRESTTRTLCGISRGECSPLTIGHRAVGQIYGRTTHGNITAGLAVHVLLIPVGRVVVAADRTQTELSRRSPAGRINTKNCTRHLDYSLDVVVQATLELSTGAGEITGPTDDLHF